MRTALLLVTCAVLIAAQPSQRLTTVTVAVEDVEGRFVEDLTAADFSVHVDGQSVGVEKVTHESTGMSVAVLLDLTTSSAWPGGAPSGSIHQTIRDHVLVTLPDDTAVTIGSFGRAVRWSGEFSIDQSDQVRALRAAVSLPEAERTGPSPIWDAVNDALTALRSRQGRQAVLLITDGQTTGNRLGLAEVADRAIAAAVPINVVFTGPSGLIRQTREMSAGVYPDRAVMQLAHATGGSYSARPPSQSIENAPVDALRKGSRATRSAYRLEFIAPVKAGFQRFVVTTPNPQHRVRAPLGFKNTPAREH